MIDNAFEGVNGSNVRVALDDIIATLRKSETDDIEVLNHLRDINIYNTASIRPTITALNKLVNKKIKLINMVLKYKNLPNLLDNYQNYYKEAKKAYKRWQRAMDREMDDEDYYERVYDIYVSKCSSVESSIKNLLGGAK